MIFAKISRKDTGNYIQPLNSLRDAIDAELDGFEEWAEVGEGFSIDFVEMTQEEYDKLLEFEGW
jgi:hypothetical protein